MNSRTRTLELNLASIAQTAHAFISTVRENSRETKGAEDEKTAPVCENGVCKLTWKPQRPHAA